MEVICYCGSITLGKMKTRRLELKAWLSLSLVVSEFGHILVLSEPKPPHLQTQRL